LCKEIAQIRGSRRRSPQFDKLRRMSDEIAGTTEYFSRLEFLYKIVEDTQGTIRFIDTKAAFCVTLLSAMVAGAFQFSHRVTSGGPLHRALLTAFIVAVALCLLVCLRVIFPVIKPQGSSAAQAGLPAQGPKFFIGHNKQWHWVEHTIRNRIGEILSENHASYVAALESASDRDLLTSMCDEVLMLSTIRQIKSDRLHAAILLLVGLTVPIFLLTLIF